MHQSASKPAKGSTAEAARTAPGPAEKPASGPKPLWQRLATTPPRLQAKLTIGAPSDRFEKEADQVADQVMRMPEPAVQRKCAACAEEEKKGAAHAKEIPGEVPALSPAAESRIQGLRGGGSPLPEPARSYFEPRFGRDFGGVRVHTGPEASSLARSISARAFTMGSDIVFGSGQYAPEGRAGQELLAHELTHVVQQGAAGSAPAVQRSCSDGQCDSCDGGKKDFWVTVFFRRKATKATMQTIRSEINGAKAILRNCCLNLKFGFNWKLLSGGGTLDRGPRRPDNDPLGVRDYPQDIHDLGQELSTARGVPMLVVDDLVDADEGVTISSIFDKEYTGTNFFVLAVNPAQRNPACNTIAHELWHIIGESTHDPAQDPPIGACTGNGVNDSYCDKLRAMV